MKRKDKFIAKFMAIQSLLDYFAMYCHIPFVQLSLFNIYGCFSTMLRYHYMVNKDFHNIIRKLY